MKQRFTKEFNKITETLELALEENWTYVHYKKGTKEKTACVLKSSKQTLEDYLEIFFKENQISEDIKKDVRKYLKNEKNLVNFQWQEFTDFLLKALTSHIVVGVAVAFSVFGGYKLGIFLDDRYNLYPLFTVIGFLVGIAIGGLTAYMMIMKYFKTNAENKTAKKQAKEPPEIQEKNIKNYPVIDVVIEQVRKAVRAFSDELPKGVYRTILVKDDNEIDFTQLAEILKGIPSEKFYMSKETYDLFPESEKLIPFEMDLVQRAVDQYVKEHKKFPVLQFDPERRINYFELLQEHYLKVKPETQFYLTDLDGMITHVQPSKNAMN
jgi:F0F1-type ATP synthase assembly protein I